MALATRARGQTQVLRSGSQHWAPPRTVVANCREGDSRLGGRGDLAELLDDPRIRGVVIDADAVRAAAQVMQLRVDDARASVVRAVLGRDRVPVLRQAVQSLVLALEDVDRHNLAVHPNTADLDRLVGSLPADLSRFELASRGCSRRGLGELVDGFRPWTLLAGHPNDRDALSLFAR